MYPGIRRQRRWSSWHCGRSSGGPVLQHAFVVALMQHDCILARIRLTRMAAERGPILSGACGQGNGFHTVHARVLRVRAPTVSTGSSVSGV
jgi:hypothetical protein